MNRKAYFDSPQEEEKEVKKSLTLLENLEIERLQLKNRGKRLNSIIVLKHHQHYPPRKVFDACEWARLMSKTKGQ